jgi:uncharacterized NAD(P)/FAD-binding protein YdhS
MVREGDSGAATECTVAIVGGGVSGTLVAAHLLASEALPRIVLVEPREEVGRGLAYSTPCSSHLLNVPAANLSALPDQPDHFLEWARKRLREPIAPYTFLPRQLFGTYVRSVLEERRQGAAPDRFLHCQGTVREIRPAAHGLELLLAEGQTLRADYVVLALGNQPPRALVSADGASSAGADRYFPSPWVPGALARPAEGEEVLLIGTGLTAVDAAIALQDSGYTGMIHAVSRHGRWPLAHLPAPAPPVSFLPDPAPTTVQSLFSLLRKQVRQAAELGQDWRPLIDGLRPRTNTLWSALSQKERTRYYRHLRALWEIHRHRMAPEIAERLLAMQREGRLRTLAARLDSAVATSEGFRVCVRPRGAAELQVLEVGRILNCTGPESDYRQGREPLLANLLAQGLAVPGPLGQGFQVTPEGALYAANGAPGERLFAVGPLRVGTLFETTAIPEIRVQALQLANELGRRYRERGSGGGPE